MYISSDIFTVKKVDIENLHSNEGFHNFSFKFGIQEYKNIHMETIKKGATFVILRSLPELYLLRPDVLKQNQRP